MRTLEELLRSLLQKELTCEFFEILNQVPNKIPLEELLKKWGSETISALVYNSNDAKENALFVAIKGYKSDGHKFIASAIRNGMRVVFGEERPENLEWPSDALYIQTDDSRSALATLAKSFYGASIDRLRAVGVTGTNGKTTTATLIHQVLEHSHIKAGLLGTVSYQIGEMRIEADRTTPEAPELHHFFEVMEKEMCKAVVMEVSSHALYLKRTEGINFEVAIFTNLTQDHLDFHGTMALYAEAKKILFDGLTSSATAITNIASPYGEMMIRDTKAKVLRYLVNSKNESEKKASLAAIADVRFMIEKASLLGSEISVHFSGAVLKFHLPQVGQFNVENAAAAFCAGLAMGLEPNTILEGIESCQAVRGRMEKVISPKGNLAFVDYAHTPDALENVLKTIVENRESNERIIVIFGCGGDRDKGKRPLMAKIAESYADIVILTSDNPRSEDPEMILDDIQAGLEGKKQIMRIASREKAIELGVSLLDSKSVLLVAGKGHETYQILGKEKLHFDDREEIEKAYRKLDR
ncbi:MAG: UDP-N-acetylmuramoyl-L-alanyl-D-glutamate--2,6-diaminopimelate ligase [Chloroherpetonaceae bacterium]|nr:UDP-N-acetylmuramoyl-L-alanyl-D-glutamate--2,6-diaminopimelate ligase [Chloroherpetonaceae bacterium]